MLRITAVDMTAVPNSGENRVPLEDWFGKRFDVEVTLPRKALRIPVLDDLRLSHSAVSATNTRLRVGKFDAPNMTAPITDSFIIFHRITVSALY
jgi:hypothetical protein